MIIGTFIFYFIFFVVVLSIPGFNKRDQKSSSMVKLLTIPALLGLVMVFLTVVKVYFIYKIFALLFGAGMFLLTYWQWGDQLRRFWK